MNTKVDQTALRVNQASIIALLVVAFLVDQPWLVAFVAAVMLIGTWWPRAALFKLLYARVLKPLGWLKPHVIPDDPQPHLFAQGVGAAFLLASALAFVAGGALLGWVLAWIVIVLAAVNLFASFCLGCFLFYQLARRGVRPTLPQWR